jgi:anti-sigma28 factor (negative regulator of flagellin synthesis)
MTSINDLFGLTNPLRRVTPEQKIQRAKPVEKKEATSDVNSTTNDDRVSISDSGKNLLKIDAEVSKYLNQIKGLVNLDEESVQEIRARIEQGRYKGPAVLAQIIADLIAPPPYVDLIETSPVEAQDKDQKQTHLTEVQTKINQGDYYTDEVTAVIADKLLESDYI